MGPAPVHCRCFTDRSACDSLPVHHVGVRGLLPEKGRSVRNLVTTRGNALGIPVSECLVRSFSCGSGQSTGF